MISFHTLLTRKGVQNTVRNRERISENTELARKCFLSTLTQHQKLHHSISELLLLHSESTLKLFSRILSQRGNDFCLNWVTLETISEYTESTQSIITCNISARSIFFHHKSHVTGSLHSMQVELMQKKLEKEVRHVYFWAITPGCIG